MKPWEERWDTDGETVYLADEDGARIKWWCRVEEPDVLGTWPEECAQLAAAAPDLVRAIGAWMEWFETATTHDSGPPHRVLKMTEEALLRAGVRKETAG